MNDLTNLESMWDDVDAETEAVSGFEPIPEGEYIAIIKESKTNTSAAGEQYESLTVEIVDGPYSNRMVWDSLSLSSAKEKWVKISQSKIKQIANAINGGAAPKSYEELLNKPLSISLIVQKGKGEYSDGNSIVAYHQKDGEVTKGAPKAAKGTDSIEDAEIFPTSSDKNPWE